MPQLSVTFFAKISWNFRSFGVDEIGRCWPFSATRFKDPGRAATGGALSADSLTDERLVRVRALNEIAARRGQTLAELALVWALRDPRMTSLVIGASNVKQLEDNIAALRNMALTNDELAEIDQHATDADVNLLKLSSDE